jgi:hypothetical protein
MDYNMLKQHGTEYLYDEMEKLHKDLKFKEMDNEIKKFLETEEEFPLNIYVGFLIITLRLKHRLKSRKLLWEKTIEKSKNYTSDKQVETVLMGLE